MPSPETSRNESGWGAMVRAWNGFWFTPRDPTVLGFIRICCGAITLYTLFNYTFALQDFLGPHAWYDKELATEVLVQRAMTIGPLSGRENSVIRPTNRAEELYVEDYYKRFGEMPPAPYPQTKHEADVCDDFRLSFGFDLRSLGLPPPQTEKERGDLMVYTEKWKRAMPPPYPATEEEVEYIDEYLNRYNIDPRRLYARGSPSWSVWFHLTDPTAMAVVHGLFLLATLMFTLGCCTRVTSFLAWFAALNYIHRNPVVVFGVDTMMTILLFYLAIGPSGAALSLDRLIARWWKGRRSGGTLPPVEPLQASVSANLAIRLLQVHVCIIYGMAGFSKLQGPAWWNGTALWGVLANFEFAPMHFEWYNSFLRFLGTHQMLFELFLTTGAYFTLAFEILYSFGIWSSKTRWIFLAAALLLHGVIGLFMGLQTFALIMLVMNMAFLRTNEVYWLLGSLGIDVKPPGKPPDSVPGAGTLVSV